MTDKEREAWQKEQALRAAERTVDMEGLPQGHPIQLLRRENERLFSLIEEIESAENAALFLPRLTEIRSHYAKTEELLMPLLYRYGVTGPSKAIWDADDEAKQMLSALLRRSGAGEELPREEVTALFARLRDVAAREEKVLFPLALRYFTEDEWNRVYRDLPEIGCAFIDEKDAPRWDEGEAFCRLEDEKDKTRLLSEGKIELPTGTLTVAQLAGILSLLPVDITFIDADDRLRFFVNEG
ncbi:MAG: hemerythrin domain-containing protein, partial [Kiritimatiellae bacterium]|nr:hemerythrin domain-containing protein [Kiritimatiellia bacterium]